MKIKYIFPSILVLITSLSALNFMDVNANEIPGISDNFAESGQIIRATDMNKLAQGVNYLSHTSWSEMDGYLAAPNTEEKFVILDSGSVGIGTNAPSGLFEVKGFDLFPFTAFSISNVGTNIAQSLSITPRGPLTTSPNLTLGNWVFLSNLSDNSNNFDLSITGTNTSKIRLKNDTVIESNLYSKENIVLERDKKILWGTPNSNGNNLTFSAHVASDGPVFMGNAGGCTSGIECIESNSELDILTLSGDGNVGIGTTSPTAKLQIVGVNEYADNAAATADGLTVGALYRTGDLLKIVH